jgi:hypothetical protein
MPLSQKEIRDRAVEFALTKNPVQKSISGGFSALRSSSTAKTVRRRRPVDKNKKQGSFGMNILK